MNQFYFWSTVIIAAIMGIFWKIKIRHNFGIYAVYIGGITALSYFIFMT